MKDTSPRVPPKIQESVVRELVRIRDTPGGSLRRVCRERLGGLNPARLTEIIQGDREVTTYYLALLMRGGVMSVEKILAGRDPEQLSQEEQDVIERLSLDQEEVSLLSRLKRRGFDMKSIMKGMLQDK